MPEHPRISLDADVLAGKSLIRCKRHSVEFAIGLMADERAESDVYKREFGI